MDLLLVAPNPRKQSAAVLEISYDDISGTGRSINFVFDCRCILSAVSEPHYLLPGVSVTASNTKTYNMIKMTCFKVMHFILYGLDVATCPDKVLHSACQMLDANVTYKPSQMIT